MAKRKEKPQQLFEPEVFTEPEVDNKQKIIDYLSIERFEYFDDRFYKLGFPKEFEFPEKFPKNFITETESNKYGYFVSSTTILGIIIEKFLLHWRGDVGNKNADYISWKALELGSEIHDIITKRQNGYDVIYNPRNYPRFTAEEIMQYRNEVNPNLAIVERQDVLVQLARYEKVIEKIRPIIRASEHTVVSIENFYAGTLDELWYIEEDTEFLSGKTVIELPKGHYIVDRKTGNNINERQYFAQLSSYLFSDNYKLYDDMQGAIIMHTNANIKSGIEGVKIYFKKTEELKAYYDYFLNVRSAFLFDNKDIKPINYEFPIVYNSIYRK